MLKSLFLRGRSNSCVKLMPLFLLFGGGANCVIELHLNKLIKIQPNKLRKTAKTPPFSVSQSCSVTLCCDCFAIHLLNSCFAMYFALNTALNFNFTLELPTRFLAFAEIHAFLLHLFWIFFPLCFIIGSCQTTYEKYDHVFVSVLCSTADCSPSFLILIVFWCKFRFARCTMKRQCICDIAYTFALTKHLWMCLENLHTSQTSWIILDGFYHVSKWMWLVCQLRPVTPVNARSPPCYEKWHLSFWKMIEFVMRSECEYTSMKWIANKAT